MIRRSFYDDIRREASKEFGEENFPQAVADFPKGKWLEWEVCWWKHANNLLAKLKAENLVISAESLERSLSSNPKAKEYMNGSHHS